MKKRFKIVIEFEGDIDMVPGWGDNTADWVRMIARDFERQTHYNTSAKVISEEITSVEIKD